MKKSLPKVLEGKALFVQSCVDFFYYKIEDKVFVQSYLGENDVFPKTLGNFYKTTILIKNIKLLKD